MLTITASTLAQALGVSHRTVTRAAARGELGATQTFGGHWRWTPEAASAVLRAHGLEPPTEWEDGEASNERAA